MLKTDNCTVYTTCAVRCQLRFAQSPHLAITQQRRFYRKHWLEDIFCPVSPWTGCVPCVCSVAMYRVVVNWCCIYHCVRHTCFLARDVKCTHAYIFTIHNSASRQGSGKSIRKFGIFSNTLATETRFGNFRHLLQASKVSLKRVIRVAVAIEFRFHHSSSFRQPPIDEGYYLFIHCPVWNVSGPVARNQCRYPLGFAPSLGIISASCLSEVLWKQGLLWVNGQFSW